MEQIPDDPRIRETELYGMPEGPEILCPVCGKEAETIYTDGADNVIGCDCCVYREDAIDWYDRNQEIYEED